MAAKAKRVKKAPGNVSAEKLYELYGPFVEINRSEEARMMMAGKWRNILCVMSAGEILYAAVGHHLVNVDVILKTDKKMPENLRCDDFWFIS
jgi:hypothetical protein